MPRNYLAPNPNNALAYSVPQPYVPGTLQDPRAVYSPYRELENLSIGLGRGVAAGLEGTKQMVTQPVVTAKALLEAARQISDDPRIVLDMLREARQRAASGALGLGELIGENVTPGMRGVPAPVMRELDVYHGTPHRFPPTEANPLGEFEASKIGTGEGAQVYGRGIYFAENPKVAKGYATEIPYRNFERKVAEVYSEFDSPDEAMIALKEAGLSNAQIKVMKALEKDDWLGFDYPHQALRAALKEPENFDLSAETKSALQEISSLYKADLPDEMIDRMLDWDKPLSEQPNVIKLVFDNNLQHSLYRIQSGKNVGKFTGSDLLGAVGEERLRQLGIPGIKYLDAGSRGKGGTGTRNFVVFPGEEKKVKILRRSPAKD